MAQHVRMDVLRQAELQGPLRQPLFDAARPDAAATGIDEERRFVGLRQRAADRRPGGDRLPGRRTNRYQARFVAFASYNFV